MAAGPTKKMSGMYVRGVHFPYYTDIRINTTVQIMIRSYISNDSNHTKKMSADRATSRENFDFF